MHRFDRRRYGKQQIVLLLFLLLIGIPLAGWGRSGSGTASSPYSGNLASGSEQGIRIYSSGTYYFKNVTGGSIVATGSNLNVTLCFEGNNELTSHIEGTTWTTSAIDLHAHRNYNSNTFTIKSTNSKSPANVKCSGAGASFAIQPGILVYDGSKVIIDGPVSVTALGGYYGDHKSPGIGGHCRDNTYWHSGSLELRNGAYLYNDVVFYTDIKQVAKATISNYASIASYNTSGTLQPLASGKYNELDYDNIDVKPTVGWHDFKTSDGIEGQIYYRESAANVSYRLYRSSSSNPSWIEIDGCPSGTLQGTKVKMGVAYSGEYGYYYKSLTTPSLILSGTIYLNVDNYTYSGTLSCYLTNTQVLDGNGKTFISDNFSFQPRGSKLMLRNMQIKSRVKVGNSVYVDTDNPGNLNSWDVIDTSDRPVWFCKAEGVTESVGSYIFWRDEREESNRMRYNNILFAVEDANVYLWIPSSITPYYINIQNKFNGDIVFKSGGIIISNHNTTIKFSRYIAAEIYRGGGSFEKRKDYASLQNAFNDVQEGEEIRLVRNYTCYEGDLCTDKPSVVFRLVAYTLTYPSVGLLGCRGDGVLYLTTDYSSASLSGSIRIFNLCVIAPDALLSKAAFYMGYSGKEKVYRTWVDKVPIGIDYLGYYRYKDEWGFESYHAGKDYSSGTESGKYCVWLPASVLPQTFPLYDGSEEGSELIATATLQVSEKHANQATAYPYV
ncbi:hypothetical protein, partial [uncultured Parabacteroides sp.]|uniref:hypothetical protein n=1 Tax=uncultured Parabacteroides sp. TaxID=512312 RepID=UPI002598B836